MLPGVLAATRDLTATVVPSVLNAAGTSPVAFVAQSTPTVVTTLTAAGIGSAAFVSELRQRISAALESAGVGEALLVSETLVVGPVAGALNAQGGSTVDFAGANAQIPPVIVPCRFITGPDNVIPVEIVTFIAPDVLTVRLQDSETGNYMPIYEDPTHPKRIKVRFV